MKLIERQCDNCKNSEWCMRAKSVRTVELCKGYEETGGEK